MGDGSKKNNGLTFCTDNFEICPTIHCEKKKYYRIYINKRDLNKILPYIKPYILDHFV